MAREPRPGAVKTRLATAIGEGQAAVLYEAFLHDTVAACRTAGVDLAISYARDATSASAYFSSTFSALRCTQQPDAGFGARLASAMQAAFASGASRVAIIGSDIPHVSPAWLTDAFAQLGDHDVVLGPTLDGGYYLIAMDAPQPGLFEDIDWSSGREFDQTLKRAASLDLRVAFTETTFDIDDERDLVRLRQLIANERPLVCPATALALAGLTIEPATESRAVAR
jgi:hypothetical protein